MAREVTAVSEDDLITTNEVGDFEMTIDASGREHADPLGAILAAYASDYATALRVAADQLGAGELGRVEIDVTGTVTEDNEIELEQFESIAFEVRIENDVDGMHNALEKRADLMCKTNYVVREMLEAEISIEDNAL